MVHCPSSIQHALKAVSKGWSDKYMWQMYCVFTWNSASSYSLPLCFPNQKLGRRELSQNWTEQKQARKPAKNRKTNILDLDSVFDNLE